MHIHMDSLYLQNKYTCKEYIIRINWTSAPSLQSQVFLNVDPAFFMIFLIRIS